MLRRSRRCKANLGSALPSSAFAQEARRVLRRLAEPEAQLRPLDEGGAGLFVKRNGFGRPVLRIDAPTMRDLLAQGLIARSDGSTYGISQEGHRFLVRGTSDTEGFQAQHRHIEHRAIATERSSSEEAERQIVAVNLAESPLSWLARRKGSDGQPLITAEQYAAGERLREDYTRGQLMARVTADWSRPISRAGDGGRESLGDSAMAARRRVNQALATVGPGLSDVLIEVCCHLHGLEEAERALRYPPRTAKVVMRIALERLAAFYGLTGGSRSVRSRGWIAEEE